MAKTYCPCCDRPLPKPRFERLTKHLLEALREIYEKATLQWVKIPAYRYRGLHARLKHWNFLEEGTMIKRDGSEQRRPGVWRVTERGEQFLAGLLSAPYEARLVADRVVEWGQRRVSFHEAMEIEAPNYGEDASWGSLNPAIPLADLSACLE